jgi:hypothetical protein
VVLPAAFPQAHSRTSVGIRSAVLVAVWRILGRAGLLRAGRPRLSKMPVRLAFGWSRWLDVVDAVWCALIGIRGRACVVAVLSPDTLMGADDPCGVCVHAGGAAKTCVARRGSVLHHIPTSSASGSAILEERPVSCFRTADSILRRRVRPLPGRDQRQLKAMQSHVDLRNSWVAGETIMRRFLGLQRFGGAKGDPQ